MIPRPHLNRRLSPIPQHSYCGEGAKPFAVRVSTESPGEYLSPYRVSPRTGCIRYKISEGDYDVGNHAAAVIIRNSRYYKEDGKVTVESVLQDRNSVKPHLAPLPIYPTAPLRPTVGPVPLAGPSYVTERRCMERLVPLVVSRRNCSTVLIE